MENTKEKSVSKVFSLPNKRVVIKPIHRPGKVIQSKDPKLVNDPNTFLWKNAKNIFQVPGTNKRMGVKYSLKNKSMISCDPLNKEEREYFEETMGRDMSVDSKENNFWRDFKVSLGNTPEILNLSDPLSYLKYKVLLLSDNLIAPNGAAGTPGNIDHRLTFLYVIEDEEFENAAMSEEADLNSEAWSHFNKIGGQEQQLTDFLNIYNWEKGNSRSIKEGANIVWLKSEVGKIIKNDIRGYINIANDESYTTKALLINAVNRGIVNSSSNKFRMPGETKPFAYSFGEAVNYLQNPKNQEQVLLIKQRLDNSK